MKKPNKVKLKDAKPDDNEATATPNDESEIHDLKAQIDALYRSLEDQRLRTDAAQEALIQERLRHSATQQTVNFAAEMGDAMIQSLRQERAELTARVMKIDMRLKVMGFADVDQDGFVASGFQLNVV